MPIELRPFFFPGESRSPSGNASARAGRGRGPLRGHSTVTPGPSRPESGPADESPGSAAPNSITLPPPPGGTETIMAEDVPGAAAGGTETITAPDGAGLSPVDGPAAATKPPSGRSIDP